MFRPNASLLALVLLFWAGPASAQRVQITKLQDADFGVISNISADAVRSQNVCVFSSNRNYNVVAFGSGPGDAFSLSSDVGSLAYEVQWNAASGQTRGTALSPGIPLAGQSTAARNPTCRAGPATSATLIVILRGPALEGATEGSYSGTLSLVIAPN